MVKTLWQHELSICVWNVNGLQPKKFDKLADDLFLENICTYDIIGLVESHSSSEKPISLSGHHTIQVDRPRSPGAKADSGGILILVKDKIWNGITKIPNNNKKYQWIMLKKEFFGFDKDLYICFTHIPPRTSSYTNKHGDDTLQCLEHDIQNFSEKGDILLCGDFNARTGIKDDFISNDNNNHLPLDVDYVPDKSIMPRRSLDDIIRDRGFDVIDLCISSQLRILNGRSLGDLHGKFTCHKKAGSSVVDYMIISEDLVSSVLYFYVGDLLCNLSDHCRLSLKLRVKFKPDMDTVPVIRTNLHPFPNKYIIDEKSIQRYQEILNSPMMTHHIQGFMNADCNSPADIDHLTARFTQIVHTAADAAFRKSKIVRNRRKQKSKPWFNQSLAKQRKHLLHLGKLLSQFPTDPHIRGSYFRNLTLYNRNRKKQYRLYKQDLIEKLDGLHVDNPKAYWKLLEKIKEFNGSDKSSKSEQVSAEDWLTYFQKLNLVPDHLADTRARYLSQMTELEKCNNFCELDYRITEAEIMECVQKLKNNKSASLDNIPNELLKYGYGHLLPCLKKLFNVVLSNSVYPKQWSEGYISTLYKSDDPSDPANYRGLTITSCLGKLFNMTT